MTGLGDAAPRRGAPSNEDKYLPLRALAAYSGLSTRTLRRLLRWPAAPLPFYRFGGKVLVRQSEFDAWMSTHRRCASVRSDETTRTVDAILMSLTARPHRGQHAR